jgi:hypothetical protein
VQNFSSTITGSIFMANGTKLVTIQGSMNIEFNEALVQALADAVLSR